MGISPTYFNYYLSKQQVKGIYLLVKRGDTDVTADYEIYKPPVNAKSFAVSTLKIDKGVSYEFSSITK